MQSHAKALETEEYMQKLRQTLDGMKQIYDYTSIGSYMSGILLAIAQGPVDHQVEFAEVYVNNFIYGLYMDLVPDYLN